MRYLAWHNSFRRAFARVSRKRPDLKRKIFFVLEKLVENPFDPILKTHKLRCQLEGLWACWVEYDCRIVFAFVLDQETADEVIALIDIGSHQEVY